MPCRISPALRTVQCVSPCRVPIHSDPSVSTSSERMKSSGNPSAEVTVSILPAVESGSAHPACHPQIAIRRRRQRQNHVAGQTVAHGIVCPTRGSGRRSIVGAAHSARPPSFPPRAFPHASSTTVVTLSEEGRRAYRSCESADRAGCAGRRSRFPPRDCLRDLPSAPESTPLASGSVTGKRSTLAHPPSAPARHWCRSTARPARSARQRLDAGARQLLANDECRLPRAVSSSTAMRVMVTLSPSARCDFKAAPSFGCPPGVNACSHPSRPYSAAS